CRIASRRSASARTVFSPLASAATMAWSYVSIASAMQPFRSRARASWRISDAVRAGPMRWGPEGRRREVIGPLPRDRVGGEVTHLPGHGPEVQEIQRQQVLKDVL